jgi:pimeloyl-ACP methyl ester carboxylesterase
MRRLLFPLGAVGAFLAVGGAFTRWQTRRTEREYPPSGRFVEVEGLRLHLVDRGPTAPTDNGRALADPTGTGWAADGSRPATGSSGRPTAAGAAIDAAAAATGPAVVLIHGLRGSSADFSFSILDRLAERYRVLAFDRPGSGYSDPAPAGAVRRSSRGGRGAPRYGAGAGRPATGPDPACTADTAIRGPGSPLTQARLLHGALRTLHVERPLLVAHSLGAALAMTYAVEYPDALAGIVTLSGHGLPFDGAIGGTSRIADIPLVGRLLVYTLITPLGLLLGPRGLRRTMAPQEPTPQYARAAVRIAIRPRAFIAAAADARECDAGLRVVYRRFGEIAVPLVALAGGSDRIISPNEGLTLSRLLPHAEYRELPGSGHMPFFADPDAVIAAVDRARQLADAGGGA